MSVPMLAAAEATVTEPPSWSELNRQWLIDTIGRLRRRLEARVAGQTAAGVDVEDAVTSGAAPTCTPALIHCARVLGLTSFERELLLLLAGLELDQGLRAVVAALHGGSSTRATFGLAMAVLTGPHWDALSPGAALRGWRLVELEPGVELAQAALRIDERLLHFVTGVSAPDARLAGLASFIQPTPSRDVDDLLLARKIAQALTADAQAAPVVVLHALEQQPALRRDFALAALAQLARPALWIEARDLPADPDALSLVATHLDREGALIGALPILALDASSNESAALGLAARLRGPLLWLGPAAIGLTALPRAGRMVRFELPATASHGALIRRWRRVTPTALHDDAELALALERAERQFHLGPAALDEVLDRVLASPQAARTAAVWPAAREAARAGLDDLAQRIDTTVTFADVVLPPGQSGVLRDVACHQRQRDRVYREWGFGAKYQLGQGLVALFAGESGTGKTLAAEVIANELALDLYRIDLAALVSKFIGETEKNLRRLFDAAEASGAVLLFDEADALFGKRSEVKDSHDRYANIEVAYLLQRVESYRGLAVLTTNMKSALDRAFLRRIRFIVNFPFPDAAARERIWRLQFPSAAPLGAIDFAALARLNLSGGNIRSVAVNAAFKAADAGTCIDQALLMAAAREEFAKLERPLNDRARSLG